MNSFTIPTMPYGAKTRNLNKTEDQENKLAVDQKRVKISVKSQGEKTIRN